MKKETLAQVFSCEFRETPKDTFFTEQLWTKPTLEESQFDTAIIQVGINDLLKNTTCTEDLLQNIVKIAASCKIHGISKIFCFKCSTST